MIQKPDRMLRDSVSHAPEYRYDNNFSILAQSNDWHETPERDVAASVKFFSNQRPSVVSGMPSKSHPFSGK